MTRDQVIPAFVAALIAEGVEPEEVEQAVERVRKLKLGQSVTGNAGAMVRVFAFAQADRLQKAATDG